MNKMGKNIKIIVLGDIGHSPRMTNHAICLANKGNTVDIIGYGDSEPASFLKFSPKIYYHYLTPCPKIPLRLINYIWKTLWTSINLFFLLFITRKSDIVLVQNPPAIPTLYISWLYCIIIRAKFVIDWHNYAHTIMMLNVGSKSLLVSITNKLEMIIGRKADHNFCVSKAMQRDLQERWNIRAEVLYDKPSSMFFPISTEKKHEFFKNLSEKDGYDLFRDKTFKDSTIFSQVTPDGEVCLKKERPAFLVSSTSWTEDEDFSILIKSLQDYEEHCQNGNKLNLPKLIVGITGKGPLKEYYMEDVKLRKWEYIYLITPWLDIEEYPYFIGSADIGVSLHTSSSGLDLPMKVVDLFGALVPVFAYDFEALNELVVNEKNGYIFSNQEDLTKLLVNWFANFPDNKNVNQKREAMVKELNKFRSNSWEMCWDQIAAKVF